MEDLFDLDRPLMTLPHKEEFTDWTIRNAVEGVAIFGGIGSGKTSGSGSFLAKKYLANQFGGLVLTVKPDELDLWKQYAAATGRENDLVIVDSNNTNFFNFLEYESTQGDNQVSITGNIVQVLKTVIRASEEKASGKKDDDFWEKALDMLIFHTVDLCLLAYERVSIKMIYDIVQNLPRSEMSDQELKKATGPFYDAYSIATKKIQKQVEDWTSAQPVGWSLTLDSFEVSNAIGDAVPDARKMNFLDNFFIKTFNKLNARTRSIIDFSFSGFLFQLLQDPIFSLFCRNSSTFLPEDCYQKGKIIIINLPVKIFDKAGRDAQIMFKYIWQRAMERRPVGKNRRPVFLWADEAQNFIHEHDATYQATARSSAIATVYISQNLHNYFGNMGGERSEHKVRSFMGTLSTKLFHSNADIETNGYASSLVGKGFQEEVTVTSTVVGDQFQSSEASKWSLMDIIRPEQFATMSTGGELNNRNVGAVMHVQGKRFPNGFNHLTVNFKQDS